MLLIIGAGFLGSYILKKAEENTDEPVIATVRDKNNILPDSAAEHIIFDVTVDEDMERLAQKTCGERLKVVYLAACHNIDYVYENYDEAYEVNIKALEKFLSRFNNIDKLIFASTDCVYGENKTGQKLLESDKLMPVNAYGKQKSEAEKLIVDRGFTVARLPYMLGPSLIAKPHFYDKILSDIKDGKRVEMIDGLYRSVLSFSQVAELIVKLLFTDVNLPHIINIASDRGYSKYDMGCILAKENEISVSHIGKISSEEGEKFFKDKRAFSSIMDNSLLKSLLGINKLEWEV